MARILDKRWEEMQKKTFTAWANSHLRPHGATISELTTDFQDGTKLVQLIECISGAPLGKYDKTPRLKVHMIQNLSLAITFINKFVDQAGIKIKFGTEEIFDGNLKIILGMLWTLISRYDVADISEEDRSAREGLLLWCQKNTKGYKGVEVQNFHTSWQDGLAFCALINKFRPDLIDFAPLDGANRIENLQMAFTVAEEKLGIPAFLTPNDVADEKPDDKSIITYLAAYWKAFSVGKKTELAAKRAGKLLVRLRANEEQASDYERLVQELFNWMDEQASSRSSVELANSSAKAQEQIDAFSHYKSHEKAQKSQERLELEAMLTNLRLKQKSERSQLYSPSDSIAPLAIEERWRKLNQADADHDSLLTSNLLKQRELENKLARLRNKAAKLLEWANDKEISFQTEATMNGVADGQAKIKVHECHQNEINAMQTVFSQCRELGEEIVRSKHDQAEAASETLQNLACANAQLQTSVDRRLEELQKLLQVQKDIEELQLDFAKKAEVVKAAIDDIALSLTDPVFATSSADVVRQQKELDAITQSIESSDQQVSELAALDEKTRSMGAGVNPFARLQVTDLQAALSSVADLLNKKEVDLTSEKQRQEENEHMLADLQNSSDEFDKWVAGVSTDSEGTAVEKLENHKAKSVEVLADAESRLEALKTVAQTLKDSGVPASVLESQIQYNNLKNALNKKTQILEDRVHAEQVTGVTAQQLEDFKASFKAFDKDGSGALDKLEFKSCLLSMGMELTEQELLSTFREFATPVAENEDGVIPFDTFVSFMTRLVKETDSYQDVLTSFKVMANDKPFVTEHQLRAALRSEDAEYLLTRMPHTEQGFDYTAYLASVYDMSTSA